VVTRIARIFNTYGPRMHEDDGRVVSNFVLQALRGEPITIYGEGTQTRSFCYVSDLIEGFVRLMALGHDPGPVNLGNPRESTIRELAELVLALTAGKSQLRKEPLPIDDPTRRCPDIAKAKAVLDWEPRVPLEEGLRKTIEYMRKVVIERNPTQRPPGL
jgi:UDP-glucuronate decarboxylase